MPLKIGIGVKNIPRTGKMPATLSCQPLLMLGCQLREARIVHEPPGITNHAIDRPTRSFCPPRFALQIQIPERHHPPSGVYASEVPEVFPRKIVPWVVSPEFLAVGRINVGQKLAPVFDVGLLIRLAKPSIPPGVGGMEGGLFILPDHSHTGVRNT